MTEKPPLSRASVADNPSAPLRAGNGAILGPDADALRGDTPSDTPNLRAALASIE